MWATDIMAEMLWKMVRPCVPAVALLTLLLSVAPSRLGADVRGCDCNLNDPESMKKRECSLCREAESQPAGVEFFVVRDINPRKPNRWLIMPKAHLPGSHPLHLMPKKDRNRLWSFAIAEAKKHFGEDDWGVAYNGDKVRTQCHLHVHAGKFIPAAENSKFKLVRRVEDFPAPSEGGILIHPVKNGFHVHTGEDIMETALVR
jgi:diadenosine tetraphosphate (Ap4A) HIT family hydrolase